MKNEEIIIKKSELSVAFDDLIHLFMTELHGIFSEFSQRNPTITTPTFKTNDFDEIKKKCEKTFFKYIQTDEKVNNESNVLQRAQHIVDKRSVQQYGKPENNFGVIAVYWQNYLESKYNEVMPIEDTDVAIMMILLKIAREGFCHKEDNLDDMCGYTYALEKLYKTQTKIQKENPSIDEIFE